MSPTTSPQPAWLYAEIVRLLPPAAGLQDPNVLRPRLEAALLAAYRRGVEEPLRLKPLLEAALYRAYRQGLADGVETEHKRMLETT